MNIKNEEKCPCNSGKTFGECCGPILAGISAAESAEALMRARYSAYVTENIAFLKNSTTEAALEDFDEQSSLAWSRAAKWQGLEIISTEKGGKDDTTGVVEFRAIYTANGEFFNHHERANFIKDESGWKFADGDFVKETPFVREEAKIGRNDPCPCGSGKKFKKCCGR